MNAVRRKIESQKGASITFALLIVILSVKPTGLFGEKTTDKV